MTQIDMSKFGLSDKVTVLTTEYPNLITARILSDENYFYCHNAVLKFQPYGRVGVCCYCSH